VAPKVVELESAHVPSTRPDGLVCDGQGRFACVCGNQVICTRRNPKLGQALEFSLGLKTPHDRVDICALAFWTPTTSSSSSSETPSSSSYRPLLVVSTDRFLEHSPQILLYDTSSRSGTLLASYVFGQDFQDSASAALASSSTFSRKPSKSRQSMKDISLLSWATPREFAEDQLLLLARAESIPSLAPVWHSGTSVSSKSILAAGTDNGAICLFEDGDESSSGGAALKLTAVIDHPAVCGQVTSMSGDVCNTRALLAACDDLGNVVLLRKEPTAVPVAIDEKEDREKEKETETERKGNKSYFGWREEMVIRAEDVHGSNVVDQDGNDDLAGLVRVVGDLLLIARRTGTVECHRISSRRILFRCCIATMPISALDHHAALNIALLCGEDGRVTIITLPQNKQPLDSAENEQFEPGVLASFALNGAMIGAKFAKPHDDNVDFVLSPAERPYFLNYKYST